MGMTQNKEALIELLHSSILDLSTVAAVSDISLSRIKKLRTRPASEMTNKEFTKLATACLNLFDDLYYNILKVQGFVPVTKTYRRSRPNGKQKVARDKGKTS